MAVAKRDDNNVPVWLGVSSADGSTPLAITVDPTTKRLRVVLQGFTTDPQGTQPAKRDENREPVVAGLNNTDQATVVPIGISSSNNGMMIKY